MGVMIVNLLIAVMFLIVAISILWIALREKRQHS